MKNIFKYKKRFLLLVGYLLFLTLAHQVNAAVTLRPVSSATCESKNGTCILSDDFNSSHSLIKDATCSDASKLCVEEKETECLTGINAEEGTAWKDRTRLCSNYLSTYITDEEEQKNWSKRDDLHCSGLFINCWEKTSVSNPNNDKEYNAAADCEAKGGECILTDRWDNVVLDTIDNAKCPDIDSSKTAHGSYYVCVKKGSSRTIPNKQNPYANCACVNGYYNDYCEGGQIGQRCCSCDNGYYNDYCEGGQIGQRCCSCDNGYWNDRCEQAGEKCSNTDIPPNKSSNSSSSRSSSPSQVSGKSSPSSSGKTNPPTEIQKKHFCEGSPKAADVAKNPGNWDSLVLTYEECVYWSKSDTKDFQKFIAENDPNVSKMWKETLQKIQTQVKPIDGVSSGVFSNIQNEIKQMDAEIQKKQQEYAQNISRMLEPGANTPAQSPTNIDANKYTNSPADQYRQACQQNTPSGVQSTVSNSTCRPGWFGIIGYNVNNLNCCGKSADALACERQKGTMSFNTCGKKKTLITTVIDSKKVFCCK